MAGELGLGGAMGDGIGRRLAEVEGDSTAGAVPVSAEAGTGIGETPAAAPGAGVDDWLEVVRG